jgi:hypothetical protein
MGFLSYGFGRVYLSGSLVETVHVRTSGLFGGRKEFADFEGAVGLDGAKKPAGRVFLTAEVFEVRLLKEEPESDPQMVSRVNEVAC